MATVMAYIVSVLMVSVNVINTGDKPNPNARNINTDLRSDQAGDMETRK